MSGRDGAVLASVLIIVLLFGIVGAMILRTGEGVGIETSRAISDAQAFWVAEAGLNHVRALLGKGANGGVAYWTLATNGYAVTVAVDPVIAHTYAAVSTGTVALARRVVRQRFGTWPQAFSYAMFAGGGELWLKRDAMIEGSGTATGNLYAAGGFTFSGAISFDGVTNSPSDFPFGAPETPAVQTNAFKQLTVQASALGSTAAPTYPLNLSGGTNYYTVPGGLNITGTVIGPGMIVAAGDVTIGGSGYLNNSIQVIAGGTLTITAAGCLGSNDLLYAKGDMSLNSPSGNDYVILTNGACALIASGTINAEKDLVFYGLLFGGQINLKKTAMIIGTVLSAGGIQADKELTVIYDSGQFADYVPMAFRPSITPLDWSELLH